MAGDYTPMTLAFLKQDSRGEDGFRVVSSACSASERRAQNSQKPQRQQQLMVMMIQGRLHREKNRP